MITKTAFIWLKKQQQQQKNSDIVKYYDNLNQMFSEYIWMLLFFLFQLLVMQNWILSVIAPVFSVTWSFRNHTNMVIWCSKNYYFLL